MANSKTIFFFICSFLLINSAHAAIWLTTSPADLLDTPGDPTQIPFSHADCGSRMRYQQVIPGSDLGQGTIGSIAFRLNKNMNFGIGPVTYPNTQISLSSTLVTPYTISEIYANNVGPDATEIFSGDLVISGSVSTDTTNPFDVSIPVNANFEFDGTKANLLIDMTMDICPGGNVILDSVRNAGLGLSYGEASNTNSQLTDYSGLVSQISLSTPPPTPNTKGLSGNWTIDGHPGEGFLIDVLDDGRVVAFWFTYGATGDAMWMFGVSENFLFDEGDFDLVINGGTTFGPGFDPGDIVGNAWGTMHISFANCNEGEVSYNSSIGFGSGTYNILKVYGNEQTVCTP
ncbi:MAG: hypothetical protein ACWA5R_02435 [bacterium]